MRRSLRRTSPPTSSSATPPPSTPPKASGEVQVRRQVKLFGGNVQVFGLPKGRKGPQSSAPRCCAGRHHGVHDRAPAVGRDPAVERAWREADHRVATSDIEAEEGAEPQLLQHVHLAASASACGRARRAGERLPCASAFLCQCRSALHEGETIKAVSEYLGHADPGFTLRTYAHLMEGSAERTKRAIDSVFGANTTGSTTNEDGSA
jgi:hypothetical protein